uniref:Uncharacterized protein n=1 Tax=Solanum lycopersicum TaxID=4081 RepID=A0A3Q7IW38_SOLLC
MLVYEACFILLFLFHIIFWLIFSPSPSQVHKFEKVFVELQWQLSVHSLREVHMRMFVAEWLKS